MNVITLHKIGDQKIPQPKLFFFACFDHVEKKYYCLEGSVGVKGTKTEYKDKKELETKLQDKIVNENFENILGNIFIEKENQQYNDIDENEKEMEEDDDLPVNVNMDVKQKEVEEEEEGEAEGEEKGEEKGEEEEADEGEDPKFDLMIIIYKNDEKMNTKNDLKEMNKMTEEKRGQKMAELIKQNKQKIGPLFDRLSMELFEKGIGHLDGLSYDPENFDVTFCVVDFEIAKRTAIDFLKNTPYSNFHTIVDREGEMKIMSELLKKYNEEEEDED